MKLRKIAPNFGRFLPSQILRGAVPQKLCPRYHASLAARHTEKFGDAAPLSPKVIGALNLTQNFEFSLPHIFFLRDTHIFELTFEAPPIGRRWAKFRGDPSRKLGDLGPKWGKKQLPPPQIFGGPRPPILAPALSKFTHFQSCLKVSRRSAEGARRYNAAKCQKQTNKQTNK